LYRTLADGAKIYLWKIKQRNQDHIFFIFIQKIRKKNNITHQQHSQIFIYQDRKAMKYYEVKKKDLALNNKLLIIS
jgi:hypothetical protein